MTGNRRSYELQHSSSTKHNDGHAETRSPCRYCNAYFEVPLGDHRCDNCGQGETISGRKDSASSLGHDFLV